jgi:hypothetical protein
MRTGKLSFGPWEVGAVSIVGAELAAVMPAIWAGAA